MSASMKMKMVKYLVSALPIHAALFPESSDRRRHMYLLCVSTARIYICNSFNKRRSNAKSKKRNKLSIGMAMFISDITLSFSIFKGKSSGSLAQIARIGCLLSSTKTCLSKIGFPLFVSDFRQRQIKGMCHQTKF